LETLASQTKSLLTATELERIAFAKIEEKIDSIIAIATPIQEEIEAFEETELIKKEIKAKKAQATEAMATFRSEILLVAH
jgi:hypothetical protein